MKWFSIAAVTLGLLVTSVSTASAQGQYPIEDYGKGSLIVPMDVCHQYARNNSKPQYRKSPICYCPTGPKWGDDGIIKAYGLIYRLLENGVIVAFVIDDQKTRIDQNDMYIYHETEPARLFNRGTGGTTKFYKTSCDSPKVGGKRFINYWGAPFVIPAAGGNALKAMQLIKDGSPGVNGRGKFKASTFATVDVHVAQADFKAPTFRKSKSPPKPLALLDLGSGGGGGATGAGVNILINYLDLAGINEPGTAGTACNPGTIYGIFSRDTQFTRDDCLRKGNYFTLWAPHWTPTGEDYEGVIRKIAEFTDAGGGFFAECAAIATLEGSVLETKTSQCNTCSFYWSSWNPFYNDQVGSVAGHFMMTNGIVRNGLSTSYASSAQTSTDGFQYRDLGSPFVQKGALSMKNSSGSHTHDWMPAACPGCVNRYVFVGGTPGPSRYKPGVVRLVSSCSSSDYNASSRKCRRSPTAPVSAYSSMNSNWDYFTFRWKDNDPQKGPVFYLGGHRYTGDTPAGVRLVLNTLLNLEALVVETSDPSTPREVVRSGPMVLPLDHNGTALTTFMQGTKIVYEGTDETQTTYKTAADKDTFNFPYREGHLRAFDTNLMASNDPTDYASLGTPLWDVADKLPPVNSQACSNLGQCRTLWTHTGTGNNVINTHFDLQNLARFGNFLGVSGTTNKQELVKLIHEGRRDTFNNRQAKVGGIDISTMSVIPPSPLAGLSTRPTMIYVGGLDGMIHAFCAVGNVAPCDASGKELWAYIPRTQLPLLRLNQQGIQGSPIVTDVFGDFDNSGLREWRTIMVVTTGTGDPADNSVAPAIIAIDVTDPTKPKVIWEVTTPATRGTNELGQSLRVSMGPVLVSGTLKTAAFVVSNNGGTGASGIYVNAYSLDDGTPLWTRPFTHDYPNPRQPSNPSVPKTGIPGGVALVDIDERGSITHVMVPTLYGQLFSLDATDGTNRNSGALFSFSEDFHPIGYAPTIYRESSSSPFYALVISSDYIDDVNAVWLKKGDNHYAVSVKIDASNTPLNETGADSSDRPFTIDLGVDQHGGAQAVVAGDEIIIVTSDQDINNLEYGTGTGTLVRYDISSNQKTTYSLQTAGAAQANVDISRGQVFVAGADKSVKIDVGTDFDSTGHTAELGFKAKIGRKLWLMVD